MKLQSVKKHILTISGGKPPTPGQAHTGWIVSHTRARNGSHTRAGLREHVAVSSCTVLVTARACLALPFCGLVFQGFQDPPQAQFVPAVGCAMPLGRCSGSCLECAACPALLWGYSGLTARLCVPAPIICACALQKMACLQ